MSCAKRNVKTDDTRNLRMRVELRTHKICILLHTSYDIMALKRAFRSTIFLLDFLSKILDKSKD